MPHGPAINPASGVGYCRSLPSPTETKRQAMSDILTVKEAGVLTITFNRPEKKNSITAAMYGVLARTLNEAAGDAQIRVVVLNGNERTFSEGNDLGDFVKNPPDTADAPVWQFLRALSAFPKPVIAAVCGAAVGDCTTLPFHLDPLSSCHNAELSPPFRNFPLFP